MARKNKADFTSMWSKAIAIKKIKYKRWPAHLVAQAGNVFQASGLLMSAAHSIKYDKSSGGPGTEDLKYLALATIASSVRFLEKLQEANEPQETPKEPEHPIIYDGELPIYDADGLGVGTAMEAIWDVDQSIDDAAVL